MARTTDNFRKRFQNGHVERVKTRLLVRRVPETVTQRQVDFYRKRAEENSTCKTCGGVALRLKFERGKFIGAFCKRCFPV